MRLSDVQSMLSFRRLSETRRLLHLISSLRRDKRGSSFIELAISMPILMVLSLYSIELVLMAVVNMQVTQVASGIADNASRLGQTDNSGVTPTVTENQIDTIMGGALRQGAAIDFEDKGRIILSSLERDPSTGKQFIHWQRCTGRLQRTSEYGSEGLGLDGQTINGMGKPGRIIKAADTNNSAVMFAEVYYDHQGIFGDLFVGNVMFKAQAAYEIRDDRNLEPGVTGNEPDSLCT